MNTDEKISQRIKNMFVCHERFMNGHDDPTDVSGDEVLEALASGPDGIRSLLRKKYRHKPEGS